MTALLRRIAVLFVLLGPLSGCAGFTLAKGGEPTDLGDGVSVQPPRDWNRMAVEKYEYWTLDGMRLQNILFVKGVEDGESIVYRPNASRSSDDDKEKDTFPKFKKGMTLLDIRELVETTWVRQKFHRTQVTNFGPAKFGGKDGFQMTFTFDTKDGLEMRGWAAGAVVGDRLFMAIYSGTKIRFYERGKNDFKEILRSYRFPVASSS
jgi:hypothetical protein